ARRPAQGRRLPGDDDGLLERHGGGRRAGDLRAWRRVQLRQGPAGPGRAGQPRCAGRSLPRDTGAQHGRRGKRMSAPEGRRGASPQDTVERAPEAARTGGDCVVIADETSTANLRWAGNTLTTNGVAAARSLTVIAIDRRVGGAAGVGVVSRSGLRPDQVEDVVREAEKAAAEASPAEDAAELVTAESASPGGRPPGNPPAWEGSRPPISPPGEGRPSGTPRPALWPDSLVATDFG